MSERNAVQHAFDLWGRSAGFEKRSGSWYGMSDEVISVSNLQKSQYGLVYFLNQGFWLRQLGDERWPKHNKCHIRFRLGSLLGEESGRLDRVLDLGQALDDPAREEELIEILNGQLLPVIHRARTLAGLRDLIDDGVFRAAAVTAGAQQALAEVGPAGS